MNAKKARKLRKSLGMTTENHRQKDYKVIKQGLKPVYFRDKLGQLLPPQIVEKRQIINTNLNYYRKVKKKLNRGYLNE